MSQKAPVTKGDYLLFQFHNINLVTSGQASLAMIYGIHNVQTRSSHEHQTTISV